MRRSDRLDSLRNFVEHAFEEPEAEHYLDTYETIGNALLFLEPGTVADGGDVPDTVEETDSWIRARPNSVVDLKEVA